MAAYSADDFVYRYDFDSDFGDEEELIENLERELRKMTLRGHPTALVERQMMTKWWCVNQTNALEMCGTTSSVSA